MDEITNPKLYRIRHSMAHVLAQAVLQKFPNALLGFGPPTDTGFFYDFDFGDQSLKAEDLKELEKSMRKIINSKQEFVRIETDANGALTKAGGVGGKDKYKIQNIQNLTSRGVKDFSFYTNGSFEDLCEGPHVANTSELPADGFKLDRIAGAYWLGDEKNKMLTRIYGLAFDSKENLQKYIKKREFAEANDHKKLGVQLDLFHFDDLVGKGLPLWMPNGTVIRDEIEKYAREMEFKHGYQRVATPHITKEDLFLKSKHLPAYKESMFPPMTFEDDGKSTNFYLKPMNCPFHHLIYKARPRSYRDLPIRLAEYGTVYRYEQSGELSGLLRVRCMCMNDAHIYLRQDQFATEFASLLKMYSEFYSTFKLSEYSHRLSIRGPDNAEKFQGDPAVWDRAEKILAQALDDAGIKYKLGVGEGAFYGPKVDFQFKNLMGREETVSTIQVDFQHPESFELTYTDQSGQDARPVVLHRAPLSTHERFISFLIEYYGGAFPTWCSPTQVVIIPVADDSLSYAKDIYEILRHQQVRAELDDSNNSLNKKIRTHTMRKTPITLVIGAQESEARSVTVRRYGFEEQVKQGLDVFVDALKKEISERVMLREPLASII